MADAAATLVWERVTANVMRCRLPFCDVTVGVVHDAGEALIVDTGTTLAEAGAVARDVAVLTGCTVRHVVLTHHHFDHVLGCSVFAGSHVYCSPQVVATLAGDRQALRADAVTHGADTGEVDLALAALSPLADTEREGIVSLGDTSVTIMHPGRGHTDHDLIAVVTGGRRPVVFCGDLVEESGDPCIDEQSDVGAWPATLARVLAVGGESAVYVPGHGAEVDAAFVRRQADWLAARG
ncbi:beta-lactamase domain-containing protein [Mycolicibacterium aurum]|uniref:Beta-lactamase domain-containing protein n=1 Tax=Mycolicibacterium aurum TaxID=1791 RepID=A0A3S4RUW3_MYCAU|nr:MBL fold metallo-hydrolase [Mycolicibacterium aurum]VEG55959.1 beta-lactamase domain-containing protein [Mycolicibacterium aurum]